jgi:hypothetical protein
MKLDDNINICIYISIIVLYEVTIKENVQRLMEILIFHSTIHKLTPFVWINKHTITF